MVLRALPIYLVFLLMGVADAMGPLSSRVSGDPAMAALMPFSVFIAFALFSVPGGVLAARAGKKRLLLQGLALCAVATAIPTFAAPAFAVFLVCVFLLGVGATFMQVAGNPMIRDICAEGAYSRSLAVAQGIKGVGSAASSYMATAAVSVGLFAGMGWRWAFPVFFALAVAAFLCVALLYVDGAKGGAAAVAPSVAGCLALLRRPALALVVLGVFLYVGAEVCMAAFLRPALLARGLGENSAALAGPSLFFGSLTLGRLAAGGIKLEPRTFFRLSAALGLVGLLAFVVGLLLHAMAMAVSAVIVCALGFANTWPMLFAITIEGMPERASELSGLMCMATCGGAVVPLCMGALGGGAKAAAFTVPVACFAYLALLSVAKPGHGGQK